MCHRASCNFKGRDGSGSVNANVSLPKPIKEQRVVTKLALPEDIRNELKERYLFTDGAIEHSGLGWTNDYSSPGTGRVYIPIRDSVRQEVGCVLRTPQRYAKENARKALTFFTEDRGDEMAWYLHDGSNICILVEDCYSGIRLWQEGISSVALLGTHLNDERVQRIKKGSRGAKIHLALDEDAYSKSIKYVLRYRNELRMQLIRLKKDVKDLDEMEMQEFVLRLL